MIEILKGQVFAYQTFNNECFAHFINTFLAKKSGVTRGCSIDYTNSSITVSSGYFVIQGRFLEEVGSTTLPIANDNEYCKLVCEVDLSKVNTEMKFLQASWKVLKKSSDYPVLIQEDLENSGNIYQLEFARFRNTISGITEFKETKTLIDYKSIFSYIEEQIKILEEGSIYLLKTGGAIDGNLQVKGTFNANINADNIKSGILQVTRGGTGISKYSDNKIEFNVLPGITKTNYDANYIIKNPITNQYTLYFSLKFSINDTNPHTIIQLDSSYKPSKHFYSIVGDTFGTLMHMQITFDGEVIVSIVNEADIPVAGINGQISWYVE